MTEKTNPAGGVFPQGRTLFDREGPFSTLSEAQGLVDRAMGDFLVGATRPGTLLALTGGLTAGRLAQGGAQSLGSISGGVLFSACLRVAAKAVGLAAESAAFAGIGKCLARLEGQATPEKFTSEWERAAINLGSLKFFGPFVRSENLVIQHLAVDFGLVAGRHLAHGFDLIERPAGGFAEQMLEAEATNWQMKAASVFLHGLFPKIGAFERSHDFIFNPSLKEFLRHGLPTPEFAEAIAGPIGPSRVFMAGKKREGRDGKVVNSSTGARKGDSPPALLRAQSETDRDRLAALLEIWKGALPLSYFQLFAEERFGVGLYLRLEAPGRPFNPSLEFQVQDGMVLLEPQRRARPNPEVEALMRFLWEEDPHPELEGLKKALRKNPWRLEEWVRAAETLKPLKRRREAALFFRQAQRMNSSLALTLRKEKVWADSALRQVSGPPRALRLPLFKEKAQEVEGILDLYFERLRRLSDDPSELSLHDQYDFPTNEASYAEAFAEGERSLVGRGGIYLGTGTSLFLPHMVHQRASQGYVVDQNRLVTEAIIPAIGALLIAAQDPIQWISHLYSLSFNVSERRVLSRTPLTALYASPLLWRRGDPQMLHRTVSDLLSLITSRVDAGLRVPLAQGLIGFFSSFMEYEQVRKNASSYLCFSCENGRGGLLSSLSTFQEAQRLWREGRITGISAKWEGPVFSRIVRDLAATPEKIEGIYASNILEHLADRSQILSFVQRLSGLPAEEDTPVIHTQGGGGEFTVLTMGEQRSIIAGLEAGDGPFKITAFVRSLRTDHPLGARTYLRTKAPQLLEDPFFQVLLPALKRPPHSLDREEALKISGSLTPEDRWRFLFALSRRGILER